jgi:hypothetical protein
MARPLTKKPGDSIGGHVKPGRGRSITELRSLARTYGPTGIRTLAAIMSDKDQPAMARVSAIKILLDRGYGKPNESHHIDINGDTSLLKVVNEIVHVHETREQIEFRDQTPMLDLEAVEDGSKKPN